MAKPALEREAHRTVTRADVLSALSRFLAETNPAAAAAHPVTADLKLLEAGLLDSLSMLQLTMFLSETFRIEFQDEDFTAETFKTAGSLAALVEAKLAEAA